MKSGRFWIIGCFLGAVLLPLIAIIDVSFLLWLDSAHQFTIFILGDSDNEPSFFYGVFCLFDGPFGAILGGITGYLFTSSLVRPNRKAKQVCIIGSSFIAVGMLWLLETPLSYFIDNGELKQHLIVLTFWIGLPILWSVWLVYQGIKLRSS